MCIVLTAASRAALATAVFNAVLSNFLGVFVAPATIFLCVSRFCLVPCIVPLASVV